MNPLIESFMLKLLLVCFLLTFVLFSSQRTLASGLDVQLKDLRNSFYFVHGTPKGNAINAQAKFPQTKECIKLTGPEVRKYGRLIHCQPEDDHVMCPLKSDEKLFAYESLDACNKALISGRDQSPSADK
jgi:hypothetical protein